MGFTILLSAHNDAAAQHIWMVGAIGSMTLAVMTRATLGHTGRPLVADPMTVMIYVCLFAAVAARIGAPYLHGLTYVSGAFWLGAFGGFLYRYGPLLVRALPRKE